MDNSPASGPVDLTLTLHVEVRHGGETLTDWTETISDNPDTDGVDADTLREIVQGYADQDGIDRRDLTLSASVDAVDAALHTDYE